MKKFVLFALCVTVAASAAHAIVPNWNGGPYNFKFSQSKLDEELLAKEPNEPYPVNVGERVKTAVSVGTNWYKGQGKVQVQVRAVNALS